MEETLHDKEFLKSKLSIINTIKHIYTQIIGEIDNVVEDIGSEKLTENLSTSIEFLKEIKEHRKNKFVKELIYN